jgi:hypothetical protein
MDTANPLEKDRQSDPGDLQDSNLQQAVNAGSSRTEQVNEDRYYDIIDDEPTNESAPFATPFQLSGAIPAVSLRAQTTASSSDAVPTQAASLSRRRQFPLRRVVFLSTFIVVLLAALTVTVFAQAIPPLRGGRTESTSVTATAEHHNGSTPQPTAKAHASPTPTMITAQGSPSLDWVPQTLPAGWTAAGLSVADALDAERTSWTFTDREMSLDFRSVGTRASHAGTFTAATFLLTPAARIRFEQNDLRAVNNGLFDSVQQRQLIQVVINAEPHLLKYQTQGQQQFAWVDVSFQLWQSQVDPEHPNQRIEGKEVDPTTKQPRVHHMAVLLLHVQSGTQGLNPPMGGTGWLVSNYALDPGNALPDTVLPA